MAVQQLGRDQARTLTDIIRGVSNVGGGIDEALQVVPGLGSATPATPVTKHKISAYLLLIMGLTLKCLETSTLKEIM